MHHRIDMTCRNKIQNNSTKDGGRGWGEWKYIILNEHIVRMVRSYDEGYEL